MRVLNLYYSMTGNTAKVADKINQALRFLGHDLESVSVDKDTQVDVLDYDRVFVGSGVYAWLPGKPMQNLLTRLREGYAQRGLIKPCSPRIGKEVISYCTYGGVHTGINEAIPAINYMGQLFDHLGFCVLGEWYFPGEYLQEKMQAMSKNGRLGNIVGRPNEADLRDVEEKVRGIMIV